MNFMELNNYRIPIVHPIPDTPPRTPDSLDKIKLWMELGVESRDLIDKYQQSHRLEKQPVPAISIIHRQIRGMSSVYERLLLKAAEFPELYPNFNWESVYMSSDEMVNELEKAGLITF